MNLIKSIAVIGTFAALAANSAYADDFSTAIKANQTPNEVSSNFINQAVDPVITIQDHIDAVNQQSRDNNLKSGTNADVRSRWESVRTL